MASLTCSACWDFELRCGAAGQCPAAWVCDTARGTCNPAPSGAAGALPQAGADPDAGNTEDPLFLAACGSVGQACCRDAASCNPGLFCAAETTICVRCGGFAELLPLPEQRQSAVNALSGDGSTAVGWSAAAADEASAVRWSLGSGTPRRFSAQLGATGLRTTQALASSRDGGVSVGFGVAFSGGAERALVWRSTPAQLDEGRATGVSADGSVIVGSVVAGSDAFRWTIEGALERLPKMTGGNYLLAHALSRDGRVVVGEGNNDEGQRRAFRWTRGGGPAGLGALAGGRDSWATSVDAEGASVVGVSTSNDGLQVFHWTASQPLRAIVALGEDDATPIVDASGSRILGGSAGEAFVWDSASESVLRLADVLGALVPSGWRLQSARGISDDALVFVGDGSNPDGEQRAWRAVLGPSCAAAEAPPGGVL